MCLVEGIKASIIAAAGTAMHAVTAALKFHLQTIRHE
jgi:hypothetical protein